MELTNEQGGENLSEVEDRAAIDDRLKEVYESLSRKRDEWVQHRAGSGAERRWRIAKNLYEGRDSETEGDDPLADVLRNGPRTKPKSNQRRSRVVVNIVAPKVEAQVARLCEILLPVDDRNWGIKPTPKPQLTKDLRADGMLVDPATGQDIMPLAEAAKGAMEDAARKAESMQATIDDALTECGYNGELRRVIEDCVKLGTGVLRGPHPIRSMASRWDVGPDGQSAKTQIESIVPASARVDPENIYTDPACGNNHQRGSGVFEKRDLTRRELRDLMNVPGYDRTAIAEILQEEPRNVTCAENLKVVRTPADTGAYEMWIYHGEFESRDFEFLRSASGAPLDPVEEASAVERVMLVMVNDRVIGALPSWSDEDFPYDFFCYTERDDSPFGDGLPHRLASQQKVVIAAWRQLMDNSGLASGGQIVVNRTMIEPADGSWGLSPMKFWLAKEDLDDVRKAFTVFEFNSHVQELLGIIDAAMKMADQESNTPLLMQGDQGAAPDNVGGTTLLFNAATAPLRYRVKRFDDRVTRPHIKRYYDWFMDQSTDPEIKGDFEIDARGSTVLVERDAQYTAVINMAGLAANPIWGPLIEMKKRESLAAVVRAMRLPPEDWVPSEDEMRAAQEQAAQQPPPQDPRIEAANIAAQSKSEEINDRKEERAFRAQVEQQNAAERSAQISYNSQREQGEFEIAMTQEQNERDIAFAKLANERNISVDKLMADWKIKTLDIDNRRQLFNAEAALKTKLGSGI